MLMRKNLNNNVSKDSPIGSLCHVSLQTPTWILIRKHILVFNFQHQKVDLIKINIQCLSAW